MVWINFLKILKSGDLGKCQHILPEKGDSERFLKGSGEKSKTWKRNVIETKEQERLRQRDLIYT